MPITGCSQSSLRPKTGTLSASATKGESAELLEGSHVWFFWCPDATLLGCGVDVTGAVKDPM